LKGRSVFEDRVGVGFGYRQWIHGCLVHTSSSGIDDIHDSFSDCSLSPDSSSGIGDSKWVIWERIVSGFDGSKFESLGESVDIGYSTRISGRTGESLDGDEGDSSEDSEDGDDDDELDEGESPHPDPLPEGEGAKGVPLLLRRRKGEGFLAEMLHCNICTESNVLYLFDDEKEVEITKGL